MKVKIQSCTKNTRTTQDGILHTGIKINGQWYNIAGDHRNLYDKEVDVEINNKWAKLIETPSSLPSPTTPASNNFRIAFWEYVDAMRRIHAVATELEPNDGQARAALVDTAMIALTTGRVELPPEENLENPPF